MTAARQFIMLSQVKINVIKIEKVCQMFVHYKNCAKSRGSMRKCAKTWERMIKYKKVCHNCEREPKAEKVSESVPKVEKV